MISINIPVPFLAFGSTGIHFPVAGQFDAKGHQKWYDKIQEGHLFLHWPRDPRLQSPCRNCVHKHRRPVTGSRPRADDIDTDSDSF